MRECDYGKLTQSPALKLEEAFRKHVYEPFPGGESIRMVAERVGDFLDELLAERDGETVALIGHRATKHGLDYWSRDVSLEEIVAEHWEWREVPIWRYEFNRRDFDRRRSSFSPGT